MTENFKKTKTETKIYTFNSSGTEIFWSRVTNEKFPFHDHQFFWILCSMTGSKILNFKFRLNIICHQQKIAQTEFWTKLKKSFFPDNRKPKPQMRKDFTGLVLCVSNLTHAWLWLLHVLPFSNQLKNTSNNKEFLKHSLLQNKCFCRES